MEFCFSERPLAFSLLILVVWPVAAAQGNPHLYRPTIAQNRGYAKLLPSRDPHAHSPASHSPDNEMTLEPGDLITANSRKGDWVEVRARLASGKSTSLWLYASAKEATVPRESERKFNVDPSNGEVATIFSEPGKTYNDCDPPGSKPCVAWPNKGAALDVIDTAVVQTNDPLLHEQRWKLFYKARYSYTPQGSKTKKSGVGWINSEDVAAAPEMMVSHPPEPKTPARVLGQGPPRENEEGCDNDTLPGNSSVKTLATRIKQRDRADLTDLIAAKIGECLLTSDKKLRDMDPGIHAFDQTVLAYWTSSDAHRIDVSGIRRDELIAIDALARTLYGEMASCFGRGLQYPEAVAKVIINRVDYIVRNPKRKSLFAAGNPHPLKHPITEIVTSPWQFSTWNQKHEGHDNPGLKSVLCPPRDKKTDFWTNAKPSAQELGIWRQAVDIAIEAVLTPNAFKRRTGDVEELYYTSGLGHFKDGYIRSYRSIGKNAISRGRCVELWRRAEK